MQSWRKPPQLSAQQRHHCSEPGVVKPGAPRHVAHVESGGFGVGAAVNAGMGVGGGVAPPQIVEQPSCATLATHEASQRVEQQ